MSGAYDLSKEVCVLDTRQSKILTLNLHIFSLKYVIYLDYGSGHEWARLNNFKYLECETSKRRGRGVELLFFQIDNQLTLIGSRLLNSKTKRSQEGTSQR